MSANPRVFLSYSWDNEAHKDWVMRLAHALTNNGVKVDLDVWDLTPGASITAYMENVARSDFVVAVCTPEFAKKSGDRTSGVGYEQQIVTGQIVQATDRRKFIPVLRSGGDKGANCAIPPHFLGILYVDFREDDRFAEKLEELLRAIFDAPAHRRPSIGNPPPFVASSHGESRDRVRVALDENGLLSQSEAETVANAVMDRRFRRVPVEFQVYDPKYSPSKELLLGSVCPAEQRSRLILELVDLQVFGCHRDDFVGESLSLVLDHLLVQLGSAGNPKLAALLFRETVAYVNGARTYHEPSTKFDLMHEGTGTVFGVYLNEQEVVALEQKAGLARGLLTVSFGLDVWDLGPSVVQSRVIPRMVYEFLRIKYQYNEATSAVDYFALSSWKVGLG